MKYAILAMLLLSVFASAAFAQSSACDKSCCEYYSGTYDDQYQYCDSPSDYTSYYECSSKCAGGSSSTGTVSGTSCCGTAFLLAAIGAGLFVRRS